MDRELFCMVPSDRNGAGRQFLVGRVRYLGSLGIAHREVVTHLRGAVLSPDRLRCDTRRRLIIPRIAAFDLCSIWHRTVLVH